MSKLEEIRKYWNIRADGYSRSVREELEENGEYWTACFSRLKTREGKALDLGCGPGMFSILLSRMGYEVTAMDYSDEMLKKAERNAEDLGAEVSFCQGDVQKLPFADDNFDLIVSRNLTWNLEKPEQAYAEWLRVLKPGGCILNFDGNHYLHYYDQEYEKQRELTQKVSGSGHKYMEGVDVSVIDEIARDLPLSHERRPDWDIQFFLKNHVQEISTEIQWDSYEDADGVSHKTARAFLIKAVKQE